MRELTYSDNLTIGEAEKLARTLLRDDAKLRKCGGAGNYQSVRVQLQFDGPGGKRFCVLVKPIEDTEPKTALFGVFEPGV